MSAKTPVTKGTKVCHRCRQEKSVWAFYLQTKSPDGRQAWCVECKQAYESTPDQIDKRNERNARNKMRRSLRRDDD